MGPSTMNFTIEYFDCFVFVAIFATIAWSRLIAKAHAAFTFIARF
jgi:hypothetical protein